MLADSTACDSRNPIAASIFAHPDHSMNLFGPDIEVDYRGPDVTVECGISSLVHAFLCK